MKLLNFLLLLGSFALVSCDGDDCLEPSGRMVQVHSDLQAFSGIEVNSSVDVHVSQGSNYEINIEGSDNLVDLLRYELEDSILGVDIDANCLQGSDVRVDVVVPIVDKVVSNGNGGFYINDFEEQTYLHIEATGNGEIEVNGFEGPTEFRVEASGNGDIVFKSNISTARRFLIDRFGNGDLIFEADRIEASELVIVKGGNGNLRAFNLIVDSCGVDMTGNGDCYVSVDSILDVSIDGNGSLFYRGEPDVNLHSVDGAGKLVKVE